MFILRREAEGGFTLVDWGQGFIGLAKNQASFRLFHLTFERWPCCPGALEFNLEILGLSLFAYNEGGPCRLEESEEQVDIPLMETDFTATVPAT